MVNISNPVKLSEVEFTKLSKFIYDNYGINLPVTKKTLLESRLQKHLRLTGLPSFKEYIARICDGDEHAEMIKMINLVSTNKTEFFRESAHFDYMTEKVLPDFSNKFTDNKEIKIWSAASSSGEEIYTIAITMEEFLQKKKSKLSYKILGTDISTDALLLGKQAIYAESNVARIPLELRRKYFLRSKDRTARKVRVVKNLREKTAFKRFNLVNSKYPNQETFDIIFCRNVLIYFDKPTQEMVIKKLCKCLKVGGYLFLGHSESLLSMHLPIKQRLHAGYEKILAC